ncbi:MAG: hypothetical protein WDA24_03590 [Tissierellales bacterium]
MYKIMVIEDDKKLQELVKSHLEKYGYETCSVEDFSQIKKEFIHHNPLSLCSETATLAIVP